jgi:ArsR family transcriptional regulator, virulence genes transcriptional regulator
MNIQLDLMQQSAHQAADLLKALANRHRLLLLCFLADGEKSVGQLAQVLGLRPSTMSQHIALLRRDRIIVGRREGQTIWYRLAEGPAAGVMQALHDAYCDAALVNAAALASDAPAHGTDLSTKSGHGPGAIEEMS